MNLISIYVGGVLTILMALAHTQYYKLFRWHKDFASITELNRTIFYTIHVALYLLFFAIGLITLFYAEELSLSNGLAEGFNVFIAFLWLWRFLWQIFYFRKDGKMMISLASILFLVTFFLLFISYFIPVINQ